MARGGGRSIWHWLLESLAEVRQRWSQFQAGWRRRRRWRSREVVASGEQVGHDGEVRPRGLCGRPLDLHSLQEGAWPGGLRSRRRLLAAGPLHGAAVLLTRAGTTVSFLGVPHQVILAAKLLRAKLAEEVPLARVNDHVSLDVLAGEKGAVAAVTLEAPLGGGLHHPRARVDLEVQHDFFTACKGGAAEPADGVPCLGGVQSRMLAERECRAVLLPAEAASMQGFVRVVDLQVGLEVVLAVKAALAGRTLERPLTPVD